MYNLYKTFKDGFKIFIGYLFSYTLLKCSVEASYGIDLPMVVKCGLSGLSMLFSMCIIKTD